MYLAIVYLTIIYSIIYTHIESTGDNILGPREGAQRPRSLLGFSTWFSKTRGHSGCDSRRLRPPMLKCCKQIRAHKHRLMKNLRTPGLIVKGIRGKSVEGLNYDVVIGMMGGGKRPLRVTFGHPAEVQDDRSLAQLMLDQIEYANVIVLSKAQILLKRGSKGKLQEIKALRQKKLIPKARIIAPLKDQYADLDVGKELLHTRLFDMEEAAGSAGWMLELEKEEHAPETEEYGISSTIFRAKNMPFHPERLSTVLNGFGDYGSAVPASEDAASGGSSSSSSSKNSDIDDVFRGVVRSKGQLWLANAHAFPMSVHRAGKHPSVLPTGEPWLAAVDKDEWEEEQKNA